MMLIIRVFITCIMACVVPALWAQCTSEQTQSCQDGCGSFSGRQLTLCRESCKAQCGKPTTPLAPLPPFVTISDGPIVTAGDISAFDAQWMQPADRANSVNATLCGFYFRSSSVWAVEQRMTALARLYELTHDRKYLDHMREFIEPALQYRDDHYDPGVALFPCGATNAPFPARPIDDFRGHVMPGWGGTNPDVANLNFVPEVVASLYGYAIATFARIVAEDSNLQAVYGSDAIRYTNAILETAWAFMPQVTIKSAGNVFEAHLSQLDIYKTKPSSTACQQAHDTIKAAMDAANAQASAAGNSPPFLANAYKRLDQQEANCQNLNCVAGAPLGHNESGAYAMMLIELWRVLDSDFYRRSSQQASNADASRSLFPVLVSRFHRDLVNRLRLFHDRRGDRNVWNYQDDQPSCIKEHAEDIGHGALDMRYLEVLRGSFDRLNAQASRTSEPIPLDLLQLDHFANTFLEQIAPGANFNKDINGKPDSPDDNGIWGSNGGCDGWVNLAVADPKVYEVCRETTLRIVTESQPYLNIGNHSALLMDKAFSAGLLSASGKITFLRVNDVGTGFGSPIEFLDAEVIVQLNTQPGKSFGFQLRAEKEKPARLGMLDELRSAFRSNRTVVIDYMRNGAQGGLIIRVAKGN